MLSYRPLSISVSLQDKHDYSPRLCHSNRTSLPAPPSRPLAIYPDMCNQLEQQILAEGKKETCHPLQQAYTVCFMQHSHEPVLQGYKVGEKVYISALFFYFLHIILPKGPFLVTYSNISVGPKYSGYRQVYARKQFFFAAL